MKIVLLRHGESKNDKLTKLGKKQVKLVLNQLKSYDFKKILCSPQTRCIETAKIVSKHLKQSFQIEDNLKERWQLEHSPVTKEEELWWNNYLNYNFSTTLKESCKDYLDRNFKVFNFLKQNFCENDSVLIVAHSATSYALLNYVVGVKNPIYWTKIGNANFMVFEI